jgi:MerR family transcriptional regulator/heat shock protein HspR
MAIDDRPLFPISVVAQMLGVHPQTLRLYEREGLIAPSRTKGKTRLYSQKDVEQLKTILYFTQDLGINLAGVALLLQMHHKMYEMQAEIWRILEHRPTAGTPYPPGSSPKKSIKIEIEEG